MRLSERIRLYREKNHLSLRAFSEQCGCSYQYINKLERDLIEKPSADMLKKMAAVMGVTLQELAAPEERSEENNTLPERFETPEQAVLWITDLPVLAFYGGEDIQKMSPEAQMEFAKEVLDYMKYLSGRKTERGDE